VTSPHWLVLEVVVPLMAAPLIVVLRRETVAWMIMAAVSAFMLVGALLLFAEVRQHGVLTYAMGSWPAPWGIEYRLDAANAFLLVLLGIVAAVVAPFAWKSVAAEVSREQRYLFYALYCLCLAGLAGITVTGDAFNIFVFLEISSLSTYVLIALGRDRRALMASYQYLILGTVGATFFVIGVGLLYLETGTLNLSDLAVRLVAIRGKHSVLAALAFITVGMSLKLALFPLHMWLPNAYAYAPSAVSSMLAAVATKVSVYVLMRFYFSVFGVGAIFGELPMADLLVLLAVAAMFVAAAAAIWQDNLKHMLAYSSISQIGYITLGIGLVSPAGLTAGVLHLFNHGITKGALFLLAGCIAMRLGSVRFDRMAGIGRTMPWTCAGIVVGGMSLIGVPATAGFVSKWYLVVAAIETAPRWIALLPLASSMLAVAYVWRFVEIAYFREPTEEVRVLREAPMALLAPAWVLVVAVVWFGLDSAWPVAGATHAAAALFGGFR
jgi:multicomponent Na+:H+ antiporter subunit D